MTSLFQERKNKIKVFRDDLESLKYIKKKSYTSFVDIPNDLFSTCKNCKANVLNDDLKEKLNVCPNCGYHNPLNPMDRINSLSNDYNELFSDVVLKKYTDNDYKEKHLDYESKTGELDAVRCFDAYVDGIRVAIGILNSNFMMGSMGSVVGEKITLLIEYATANKLPLVIFSSSGGARMQEGIISLMQMGKTSMALNNFKELFISILTNPTTGGVLASFASLGDITIAEPKSVIGFAGRRVIENTIKEKLPDEFQTSEFLLEKGYLDLIVERKELKNTIVKLLKIHGYDTSR
ncbi:MAG: acetyl-CoA carboxylase, carboxyltransferase subunit beta [Anaeroplasmataceae bacterium]